MKNLNKKYRCIPEFYTKQIKDGAIVWDFIKHDVNKSFDPILSEDCSFVYCYNGKIIVTKESKDILRIDFKTKNLKKSILPKLTINIIEEFEHDDGATIWIAYKDFDLIAQTLKAKKQGKIVLAIFNKRNSTYWERYLKIWDNEYLLGIPNQIEISKKNLALLTRSDQNKAIKKEKTVGRKSK